LSGFLFRKELAMLLNLCKFSLFTARMENFDKVIQTIAACLQSLSMFFAGSL